MSTEFHDIKFNEKDINDFFDNEGGDMLKAFLIGELRYEQRLTKLFHKIKVNPYTTIIQEFAKHKSLGYYATFSDKAIERGYTYCCALFYNTDFKFKSSPRMPVCGEYSQWEFIDYEGNPHYVQAGVMNDREFFDLVPINKLPYNEVLNINTMEVHKIGYGISRHPNNKYFDSKPISF